MEVVENDGTSLTPVGDTGIPGAAERVEAGFPGAAPVRGARVRDNGGMEMPRNDRSPENPQILVVGQDGMALSGGGDDESREIPVTEQVEQPAKVMRIGSMIKQLLEEVRVAPLDEASRVRLKEIHASSVKELEDGLAPELVEELERLSLPFTDDGTPTDAELRIAQAQLVGWLEGLFHGIQTTLFAQQMAARAQLEQMRRALPPGVAPEGEETPHPGGRSGGPYL
ncbi:hypothetical protein SUDANB43_03561 [Streptomyces sp. enrichment culture]